MLQHVFAATRAEPCPCMAEGVALLRSFAGFAWTTDTPAYQRCTVENTDSADLREYDTLRQEINNRTTIAYTLVALDLAALGGGLSIVDKSKHILVGLAAISSLLWLYWIDHAAQVQRIAAYIAIDIAPRVSAAEGHPVLRWETFLRRLTAGGDSAREVLFGPDPPALSRNFRPIVSSDWYTTLLFGGSPPLLLGLYIIANAKAGPVTAVEVGLAVAAAGGLGCYALISYRRLKHAVPVISAAILAAGSAISQDETTVPQTGGAEVE